MNANSSSIASKSATTSNRYDFKTSSKWAIPGLFFFISVFFEQTSIQFYNKLMWKNDHPVYGAGIRTHNVQIASLTP